MSFKAEFLMVGTAEPVWITRTPVFASREEAEDYGHDMLVSRPVFRTFRVEETADRPTAMHVGGYATALNPEIEYDDYNPPERAPMVTS